MLFKLLKILCLSFLIILNIQADSFKYNTFNNHGVVGLINMPSARIYEEGAVGITLYDGTPDQKITMTSSPYNWLEASFFYTNIQGKPYPGYEYQDYKDKGFNLKIKLKDQDFFPAIAFGINDIAGTGFYSSEYIVGSYGINKLDMHFGIGWGTLNSVNSNIKNPLIYLSDRFKFRPKNYEDEGGQFQPSRYFSDENVSPYFGFSYAFKPNLLIKLEKDTTNTSSRIDYDNPKSEYSFGIDYLFNKNFVVGMSFERGNFASFRFTYKQNAAKSTKKYKYQPLDNEEKTEDKYLNLVNSIQKNNIGVNKIIENNDFIGIEVTQFTHPNLNLIEEILMSSKKENNIKKDLKVEYRIADLKAYQNTNYTDNDSKVIYVKKEQSSFNTSTNLNFRPFLAAREGFFKYSVLLENNSQWVIKDNLHFTSNLKYSLKDNFDDLFIPPVDTYPEQVRSDVKDYLNSFGERVIVGRAQFDYYKTLSTNNHLMLSAGIFEEMFNGYGFEYLNFDIEKNYAFGFEAFHVYKRDYDLRFRTLDYETNTAFLNFYYRNDRIVPFDLHVSHGKYLAGDVGSTIELQRRFKNGAQLGVFATFTNVSSSQFGEGSFDKGIFFNIPIYKNYVNYTWRPLTKDPGAKLTRAHTLHGLLVRFKPFNDD